VISQYNPWLVFTSIAVAILASYTALDLAARMPLARDAAILEVSDTGVGLTPDVAAHVFDPFFQAKDPPHGPNTGLGLGLSLVRQLVQMHGGEIEVFSAGPGNGATFTVRFLAVQATREPAGAEAEAEAA
jgi:signal transduction histidine kinase